jgi:hypothetical protein
VSAAADALESRRQVLLATVALQRFALRGDVGSLRASLRPAAWTRPVAIAALAITARWLARRSPMAGTVGALRLLPLALGSWTAFMRR